MLFLKLLKNKFEKNRVQLMMVKKDTWYVLRHFGSPTNMKLEFYYL